MTRLEGPDFFFFSFGFLSIQIPRGSCRACFSTYTDTHTQQHETHTHYRVEELFPLPVC